MNEIRRFEPVAPQHKRQPADAPITLPRRATARSAAYDVFSPQACTVAPHGYAAIWTDVKARFPGDEALVTNVRSSMGRRGIMLANTQGWIDSDYYSNPSDDGNICIMLYNLSDEPFNIAVGDRIAQAMFVGYRTTDDDKADGVRTGGWGSTGK